MKNLLLNLILVLALAPTGLAQYVSVPLGHTAVISSGGVLTITAGTYDVGYSSQFSPYHYFTGASGWTSVEAYREILEAKALSLSEAKIEWARRDSLSVVEFQEYRRKRELRNIEIIRKYMPDFKKDGSEDE